MIEKLFVRLARAGARAFPPPPPRGCSQRLTQACHLPPRAVPAVAVAACNGGLLAPGPSTGTAWPFVWLVECRSVWLVGHWWATLETNGSGEERRDTARRCLSGPGRRTG